MQNNFTRRLIVDVCNSDYIKSVKCDVPISEGFGPENLVSTNPFVRSKGFLAERFIKPPVILTFDFKCKIDLKYLVIDCCVGAQKTNGIELFTQQSSNQGMFESIASGVLPDNKRGFVFHRYDENVSGTLGENFLLRTFKYRTSQYLSSVQSVKIKIFRSGRTCVPALGKLSMFGVPEIAEHSNKPSVTRNCEISPVHKPTSSVNRICPFEGIDPLSSNRHINHQNELKLNSGRSKLLVRSRSFESYKCSTQVDTDNLIIPEDFLDPITCEIMTQPIILPSGKVIDYSTLEKYEKVESTWGRGPSDPFTGLAFNESKKPIAASDLKVRIDKFLTDNCNTTELKSIPRTLGKASHSVAYQGSNSTGICVSKLLSIPQSSTSSSDIDISAARKRTQTFGCIESKSKLRKIELDPLNLKDNPKADNTNEKKSSLPSTIVKGKIDKFSNMSNPLKAKSKGLFCQKIMDDNLEEALKSTLSKLPNLTADKDIGNVEGLATTCQVCISKDNLFSAPCRHLICRLCLINTRPNKTITCSKCSYAFKPGDVQKVHLNTVSIS